MDGNDSITDGSSKISELLGKISELIWNWGPKHLISSNSTYSLSLGTYR